MAATDLTPKKRLELKLRDTARETFWSEFDKDSYECPVCGRSDVPMDVHHRDGDPFNNHPINLIGVCDPCHRAEHKRRSKVESLNAWKEDFRRVCMSD